MLLFTLKDDYQKSRICEDLDYTSPLDDLHEDKIKLV